jgi:hypothetical protein
MKAYTMGSAINAPNNALNISSLVMAYAPHVFGFGYHSTWNHADKAFYQYAFFILTELPINICIGYDITV